MTSSCSRRPQSIYISPFWRWPHPMRGWESPVGGPGRPGWPLSGRSGGAEFALSTSAKLQNAVAWRPKKLSKTSKRCDKKWGAGHRTDERAPSQNICERVLYRNPDRAISGLRAISSGKLISKMVLQRRSYR